MVTSHPLTLISIADGSFLCTPCGQTVYSTQHTCEEQREEMARQAARLLANEDN